MEYCSDYKGREDEITSLFNATFSASEGPDEGKAIGALVKNLLETTKDEDLLVFLAWQEKELVGAIVFSRLIYPEDERSVFILAPVAVAPSWQRKGVGQALMTHSLNVLRELGVDVAITYGDPNYYAKVGFKQITEDVAQAPLTLHQPEGWLAQPLNGPALDPLHGPSRCVEALNDSIYW
ncbi:MAG: N-acetyltransferase [Alphaproteobacteria bacterium]|nr:N-acetyltransferase [Alphaproteobacteria bacterium]